MASSHTIFQLCIVVNDVRQANAHRARILGLPHHVGHYPGGSCS